MIKLLQAIENRMYAVLFTWHRLGLAGICWRREQRARGYPHDFSESWGKSDPDQFLTCPCASTQWTVV
jgi:hypothetical protein